MVADEVPDEQGGDRGDCTEGTEREALSPMRVRRKCTTDDSQGDFCVYLPLASA